MTLATAGVILRPWGAPEAVWAVLGAGTLTALGLVPWPDAARAILGGADVYLFLAGMMLVSEIARREGLFDTLAGLAARSARGSPKRLFALVYGVGVVVTAVMSNDATAVVLTPAVLAVARAARAEPLPLLFACAFVANAASFVLPISNPANLVVYGAHMPSLGAWLAQFALPSALSIAGTFAALWWNQRGGLRGTLTTADVGPVLTRGGRIAAGGVAAMAVALLAASWAGAPFGWAAVACAGATLAVLRVGARTPMLPTLRGVSWGVLPLVAGLFVLVEGLHRTGVVALLAGALREGGLAAAGGGVFAGVAAALGCNLLNNLPAGLLAGAAVQAAGAPADVAGAVLVGIDLGPNLSITGSLATLLWLVALRREGVEVGAWQFLKVGAVVMPPALALALAALGWQAGAWQAG